MAHAGSATSASDGGNWAALLLAAGTGAVVAAAASYYFHSQALAKFAEQDGKLKPQKMRKVTTAPARRAAPTPGVPLRQQRSQRNPQANPSNPYAFDPLAGSFSPGSLPGKLASSLDRQDMHALSAARLAAANASAAVASGLREGTFAADIRSMSAHSSVVGAAGAEEEEEKEAEEDDMAEEGEEAAEKKEAEGRGEARVKRAVSVQDSIHHPVSDPGTADRLRKAPEVEDYVRLNLYPQDMPSAEDEEVCVLLQECLQLRDKYVFREAVPPWHTDANTLPMPDPSDPFRYEPLPPSDHVIEMVDGVVKIFTDKEAKERGEELFPMHDATTFFTDLHRILKITSLGHVRSLCFHRLRLLEQRYHLHLTLNADREFKAQKSAPHRDLYNVRKVDTHVHHSACMNQKHLLRFIKSKLRKEPDEVVIFRDGKYLTLKEVFESLDLTGYDLNVDLLDVHADKNTFHRFDKFNLKYNPCGQSRLREIFIKQDNLIQGRFLAEVTKEVFTDLVASKYQMAEYRVSIYGRKMSEWDQLASWVVNNDLYCPNVVWLIQLPRLYNVYKEMGIVSSFQTMLDNIFLPLFEVTVDPSSHPHLHIFLNHVVGFDMVDDESRPERRPTKHMITPAEWTNPFNPAYAYYTYYVYANLYKLNRLRESKGLSVLKFRPHSGEAGDVDHLAATFLTAHNIAHGNNLRRTPALQHLYYLAQIGLAMSPLSNNSLFLDYHKNPFPQFFARGLNVSLSTDDPLMIHLTKEPLVEEYSIAAQVWRLTSCDLCEIARNSVYQSGFWHPTKAHWIGPRYFLRGPDSNDIHRTNVPHIRVEFRYQAWEAEMEYVYLGNAKLPQEIVS
ncbi:hypothetical protein CLOM_g15097 [Closterium sp. NIES-68]|nr:hypothetical protein CLOM_g15097 [Closterium sp. NIES-68]GJP72744.1 hypothetical protein CLOP_g3494 [Closterium sp. NIES-67]